MSSRAQSSPRKRTLEGAGSRSSPPQSGQILAAWQRAGQSCVWVLRGSRALLLWNTRSGLRPASLSRRPSLRRAGCRGTAPQGSVPLDSASPRAALRLRHSLLPRPPLTLQAVFSLLMVTLDFNGVLFVHPPLLLAPVECLVTSEARPSPASGDFL